MIYIDFAKTFNSVPCTVYSITHKTWITWPNRESIRMMGKGILVDRKQRAVINGKPQLGVMILAVCPRALCSALVQYLCHIRSVLQFANDFKVFQQVSSLVAIEL